MVSESRLARYAKAFLPARLLPKAKESERVQRASVGAATACLIERVMSFIKPSHPPELFAVVVSLRRAVRSQPLAAPVRRVKHSVHSHFAYREVRCGTLVTICNSFTFPAPPAQAVNISAFTLSFNSQQYRISFAGLT